MPRFDSANPSLEPTEPQAAFSQKPKMPLKLILFDFLGLLLVSSLIYGAYWYGKRQVPPPTPEITPPPVTEVPEATSPAETVNWKTYTNTKYGYSISYPNNWDVKEFPESSGQLEVTSFNPNKVTDRLSAIFITISPRSYEQEAFGNGDPVKVGNFTGEKVYGGAPPGTSNVHLRVAAPLKTGSIIFESSTDYEKVVRPNPLHLPLPRARGDGGNDGVEDS